MPGVPALTAAWLMAYYPQKVRANTCMVFATFSSVIEWVLKEENACTTDPSFSRLADSFMKLPVQWASKVALTALFAEEHLEA